MNIEFEGRSFYMAFAVDEDNQWVIEDTIERQGIIADELSDTVDYVIYDQDNASK